MAKRNHIISDIRDLLDFLEANPEVPLPYMRQFDAFGEADKISEVARSLGTCEKEVVGSYFVLIRRFGTVRYESNFSRDEVCTATVVGTEDIPEKVIPAHTRDIVEWECPDSILDR